MRPSLALDLGLSPKGKLDCNWNLSPLHRDRSLQGAYSPRDALEYLQRSPNFLNYALACRATSPRSSPVIPTLPADLPEPLQQSHVLPMRFEETQIDPGLFAEMRDIFGVGQPSNNEGADTFSTYKEEDTKASPAWSPMVDDVVEPEPIRQLLYLPDPSPSSSAHSPMPSDFTDSDSNDNDSSHGGKTHRGGAFRKVRPRFCVCGNLSPCQKNCAYRLGVPPHAYSPFSASPSSVSSFSPTFLSSHEYGQRVKKPRTLWTAEEDKKLTEQINMHGPKHWAMIAENMGVGVPEFQRRTGKQCRERWHNHLDPSINKGAWSPREDMILITAHRNGLVNAGSWADIAKDLPGRSDNAVKNRWHLAMTRAGRTKNKDGLENDMLFMYCVALLHQQQF